MLSQVGHKNNKCYRRWGIIKVLDSTCGKFATVDCNISNRQCVDCMVTFFSYLKKKKLYQEIIVTGCCYEVSQTKLSKLGIPTGRLTLSKVQYKLVWSSKVIFMIWGWGSRQFTSSQTGRRQGKSGPRGLAFYFI